MCVPLSRCENSVNHYVITLNNFGEQCDEYELLSSILQSYTPQLDFPSPRSIALFFPFYILDLTHT